MSQDRSIVIIGGGPTGLATAICAKRAAIAAGVDVPVTVLEQRHRSPEIPTHGTHKAWGTRFNALSLSKTGMHNLAALGVDFDDSKNAIAWEFSRIKRPDRTVVRHVRPTLPDPSRATHLGRGVWMFPQVACLRIARLERSLLHTAKSLGIEIFWGVKASGFEDAGHGTIVHGINADGAPIRRLAWLAVIADGSRRAHQRAVLGKTHVDNDDRELIETLGVTIDLDSPDLGRFIAAPFRCSTGGPGLHINAAVINGLPMQVNSRFDTPEASAMVQARLPTENTLTDTDKRAWLAWAAREHGIEEPAMLEKPVEFTIAATHTRHSVVRNQSSDRGIAGSKLLIGMTRASTPQTHGSGYQATGLSDAFAVGLMVKRILRGDVGEDAALAGYGTGRNNAARMLARKHSSNTPIFGLRSMRIEDFDHLVGEARQRGYLGDQPYLA